MSLWVCWASAALSLAKSATTKTEQTHVDVTLPRYGTLRGMQTNKYRAWLGIPYARSPTKSRRFRPPALPDAWGNVRNATSYGPGCMQTLGDPVIAPLSENCLFLNVYTPPDLNLSSSTTDKLPVLVWIHGGSYTQGSGNESRLDGTFTVQEAHEGNGRAIYVTLNYRLNIFGFLGGDLMRALDPHNSTGNIGLQDQRMALQWVQDHISLFGGDPRRVLIEGQSAGAGSVSVHLTATKSWGLFQRASMQSGAFGNWVVANLEDAEKTLQQTLLQSDCSHANVATSALEPDAKFLDPRIVCLQQLDAETLLGLADSASVNGWGPVVDGVELRYNISDEPWVLLREGRVAPGVSVAAGSVRDDGPLDLPADATKEDFSNWLLTNDRFASFNASLRASMLDMYSSRHPSNDGPDGPHPNSTSPYAPFSRYYWATAHLIADAEMFCPARRTARYVSVANAHTHTDTHTSTGTASAISATSTASASSVHSFLYLWSYPVPAVSADPSHLLGAAHSCETPFLFHVLRSRWGEDKYELHGRDELELSTKAVGYWYELAVTGDAGTGGVRSGGSNSSSRSGGSSSGGNSSVRWPSYSTSEDSILMLDTASRGGVRVVQLSQLQKRKCEFWDSIIDLAPIY